MTGQEEFYALEKYVKMHSSKVRRCGNGITFCCPYHNDSVPSASLKMGRNGYPLSYCSVCGSIYHQLKKDAGLWQDKADSGGFTPFEKFLYYNTEDEYKMYDFVTEKYLCSHFRMKDKEKQGFPRGIRDGEHVTKGTDGIDTTYAVFCNGHLKELKNAIEKKVLVCYTEGEKDTKCLWNNDCISFTCGGINTFKKELLPYLKGGRFVVFGDNDKVGIADAERITALLNTVGTAKMIVPPEVPEKGDISDYMQNHTKEDLQALIDNTLNNNAVKENAENTSMQVMTLYDVLPLLSYKKDGKGNDKIIQSIRNFETVLEYDSRFAGKIRFNEFAQQPYLVGKMPWTSSNSYRVWSSFDDSALFSILQSDYGLNNRNDYFDAIKNVSMSNKYHPIRDLLDTFEWDGKEHIRTLLPDYLGAEDIQYNYEVMRLFMIGAVARIYKPGTKFDYTPIFTGKQGLGKSTFLRLLALDDNWFNDSLDSLDSDKAAQSLLGSWIIELAELKSLARTAGGVDSVKRFLTATQDKYRVPYERRADIFLRQSVFCGTTNKSDFLQDETGNRRFLVIQVGINEVKKDLFSSAAINDIRAAWAQAVYIYKKENPKFVLPESCKEEAQRLQEDSVTDDGKIGIITEYLADKQRTCALEIWQEALHENGRPQKWQASEINNIIGGLPNWKKMNCPTKFGNYGNQRGFQKVCSAGQPQCNNSTNDCSSEFVTISDEQMNELPFE